MAIRMRYGTDAEWEAGKSNLVTGEPAVTTDTERAFIGTNGLLGADYSDGNISYMELANLKRIAPQHDIYERYKVGDLVFYHGELYECTIPYRGVFNTIYFKRVSLGDVISGLRAKDMYANFESTSASGDIVSIDNGAGDIPIKELVTEITATQDLHGYDAPWAGGLGKNIWHYSDVTYTHNGVTFTVSNNIATVNGTATGGDAYIPMFISGAFEANQPYTISGCPSGGSLSTYFLQQNYWGGSQQAGAQDVGSGRTFTPLNSTIHVTYIFIKEGYTANNLVFKIMLEKGSTKSAYEIRQACW